MRGKLTGVPQHRTTSVPPAIHLFPRQAFFFAREVDEERLFGHPGPNGRSATRRTPTSGLTVTPLRQSPTHRPEGEGSQGEACGASQPSLSHPLGKMPPWPQSSPPHPTPTPASARPPPGPAPRPGRPQLRLIPGGRSPQAMAATYRRRRLVAGPCSLVLVTPLFIHSPSRWPGSWPTPPAAGPAAPEARPVEGPTVTVEAEPGDTLWTIARRVHPGDDVRPLVAAMVWAERGGAGLQVGDQVRVHPQADHFGSAPHPVGSPGCAAGLLAHLDDKVVDSRASDDGSAIRRRRECLSCGGPGSRPSSGSTRPR